MKVLNFLCLLIIMDWVRSHQIMAEPIPKAIATVFRAEDKVYITNLKPKAKVAISVQRITFRKLVTDRCGEMSFKSSTIPALVLVESQKSAKSQKLVESQKFIPAKFALEATRVCTKDSPKSDRSYKASNTKFVLAGLKPQRSYLLKIIKPTTKNLTTNKCGYGSIPITQSLTSFASSYEDNIYAINGKKLKDLSVQEPPSC